MVASRSAFAQIGDEFGSNGKAPPRIQIKVRMRGFHSDAVDRPEWAACCDLSEFVWADELQPDAGDSSGEYQLRHSRLVQFLS